jgi:hypothetical protein
MPAQYCPTGNCTKLPAGSSAIGDTAYAAYYSNPNSFFGTAPAVLSKVHINPYRSENLSVLKKTKATERVTIEFGAEFFNAFNRHSYFMPDQDLRSATFGQESIINNNVYLPRVIQLRLRGIF